MPSQITGLFHVTHGVRDVREVELWFEKVFQRRSTDPGYLEPARRYARFTGIGDLLFESVGPDGRPSAIQSFVSRSGNHLNSLAWGVKSVEELAEALREAGVRLFDMASQPTDGRNLIQATLFGHPRDTHGMLEFFEPEEGSDDGRWKLPEPEVDPLGIVALSHVTLVVRDRPAAARFWRDVLGATEVAEADNPVIGAACSYLSVGEMRPALVELAQPTSAGLAAADLDSNGEILHSLTFTVRDLAETARYLTDQGVVVASRNDEMLVTEPTGTVGVPFGFRDASAILGGRTAGS